MNYHASRALELLCIGSGIPDAQFREGQEEAIRHVVEGMGRLLVVQKTGWGKSFVYFIATKLLRESGAGPALLISPLLSLMRNQIAAAERMGVRTGAFHSENKADWTDVEMQLSDDAIDILLITPERLTNNDFRGRVFPGIAERVALLIVDEVHCISDWGHDFRPDYQLITRMTQALPDNLRLLGTTATANDRVMKDLAEVFGPNIQILRGDLSRPSLLLQTISLPSQAERLAWLAERLGEIPGSGIIYTLTIRDAEQVTNWLQSQGLNVRCYTGRSGNRPELEQDLLNNRVKALVATTALGMGFDKLDLAFVIHYQTPGSVVHYYQQVGRAGRGLDAAYGALLSGIEDTEITDYFIRNAFPTKDEVHQIIMALEDEPAGLSEYQLQRTVNIRSGRITQAIKLLSLESPAPIAKQGAKWQLTPARLSNDFWERADRLTTLRHEEQQQMQEYVALDSGHMEFLIRSLDGNPETVKQPDLPPLPSSVEQGTVLEAVEFLRRTSVPIEPRKQWGPGQPIPMHQRAEVGKALCYWGDAGWGSLVSSGKYNDNHFSDDLVVASAQLVREWNPEPAPAWVTFIPSLRHPTLVLDFAQRLAAALGLPLQVALAKTTDRPEQKAMANSFQQQSNVVGSLGISQNMVLTGPVLLVDDMVDSGWTFTVAASLLRRHGCSVVFPLALADTGNRQG